MATKTIIDTKTVEKVIEKFHGTENGGTDKNDIPILIVPAEQLHEVMLFLRDEQKYDYFNCQTAAEDDDYYISLYTLYAILDASDRRLTVKINSPKDNPHVPSVVDIYPAADWFERESYDLMGIIYDGHPNLTRILTTDDWVGHTLRRDYKIVEPESYVNILKKEIDQHVIDGLQRSDVYKGLKDNPLDGIVPASNIPPKHEEKEEE